MNKGLRKWLVENAEEGLQRYKEFPFWYILIMDGFVVSIPLFIILALGWLSFDFVVFGIIGYPFFSFFLDRIVLYFLKDEDQAKGYGGRFIM